MLWTGSLTLIHKKSNCHSLEIRLSQKVADGTMVQTNKQVGQSAVYKHYSSTTTPWCTKVIPKGHHHGMHASWYGASFKLFVKEFGLQSNDKGVHDVCNMSSNVRWFHCFTGNSYILLNGFTVSRGIVIYS